MFVTLLLKKVQNQLLIQFFNTPQSLRRGVLIASSHYQVSLERKLSEGTIEETHYFLKKAMALIYWTAHMLRCAYHILGYAEHTIL
jgi:hypothetical protein